MKPLSQFIVENKITATAEYGNDGPKKDWPAIPWTVTLKHGGHRLTVNYWTGPATHQDPGARMALDSLRSDAGSIEGSATFEEWAESTGYDSDSRHDERLYNACTRQTAKLARFLGADLLRELLYEVEGE